MLYLSQQPTFVPPSRMLLKPVAISLVKVFCLCPVAGIFLVHVPFESGISRTGTTRHQSTNWSFICVHCNDISPTKRKSFWGWSYAEEFNIFWEMLEPTHPWTHQLHNTVELCSTKPPQISSIGHLVVASLFIDRKKNASFERSVTYKSEVLLFFRSTLPTQPKMPNVSFLSGWDCKIWQISGPQ